MVRLEMGVQHRHQPCPAFRQNLFDVGKVAHRIDDNGFVAGNQHMGDAALGNAVHLVDGRYLLQPVGFVKFAPGIHAAFKAQRRETMRLQQLGTILRGIAVGADGDDLLVLGQPGEVLLLLPDKVELGDIDGFHRFLSLDAPGVKFLGIAQVEKTLYGAGVEPIFKLLDANNHRHFFSSFRLNIFFHQRTFRKPDIPISSLPVVSFQYKAILDNEKNPGWPGEKKSMEYKRCRQLKINGVGHNGLGHRGHGHRGLGCRDPGPCPVAHLFP